MMAHRQVVSITSPRGQKRLRQCKQLAAFFRLAPHFQPQIDPFHCAVANAVICLNALAKAPQPFRQHSLLGPATRHIKSPEALVGKVPGDPPGLTLAELERLVTHFGLKARREVADAKGLECFRKHLAKSMRSAKTLIVCNFTFEVVLGSGGGHFSPVAAYHPPTDSVLVLDVANHRTLWYWAPVKRLYQAMQEIDSASGTARGYLVLSSL